MDCYELDYDGGACSPETCFDTAYDLGSVLGDSVATGSTSTPTSDEIEGSCFGYEAASETVYGWTAPSTGEFCFDLIDSTYDTSLAVFDEYCGAELACDEDGHGGSFGFTSYVTVSLSEGDTVSVVVDAWSLTSSGEHILHINEGACTP